MKLSELKAENFGFEKLTCTIYIDAKQLYPGALTLKRLHIDTTCELKTNTAELSFCDISDVSNVTALLQSGAGLRIMGGYQKNEELMFLGYIHSITLSESGNGQLRELEIYAQDVKGLMMLHKQGAVENGKTKNAILQDILKAPLYADCIGTIEMQALPAPMDTMWYSMGCTDFDILERLCGQAFYTCYVRGDVLRFEPRYTSAGDTIELDDAHELYQVELSYTMQDMVGSIQAAACDGYEDKKLVQEKVSLSSLPYTKKLQDILKYTSTSIVDDGFHNIDELKYIVSCIKKEVEHGYARANGQCVFLPWLLCATELILPKTERRKQSAGIATHVIHHMDEAGAYTEWEIAIQKG